MLEDLFKQINKEFKKDLAIKGIGNLVLKRIPFTSLRLNYITYGGVPRGRVTMLAGRESSGKSSLALDVVKNAQIVFDKEFLEETERLRQTLDSEQKLSKQQETDIVTRLNYLEKRGPLKIVYFDAEGTLDSDWARKLGVDVDNVYLVRLHTQTAEQFLDQVMRVVRDTDDVGLVIIDSIAVLVPQLVHGESFKQKNMGGNAKVVTDFCNEVCPVLGEKDIACIVINQARDDFKNPYADFKIPCGNSLKLASSLILTCQKGKLVDEAGKEQTNSYACPEGNKVWVRIQKTKICKPNRRVGFFTLSYDYGVDSVADIVPLAVENFGIIKKGGSWFTIVNPDTGEILVDQNNNPIKIQGEANLVTLLRQNEELYNFIYDRIYDNIMNEDSMALQIDRATDLQAISSCNEELEQETITPQIVEQAVEQTVEQTTEQTEQINQEITNDAE